MKKKTLQKYIAIMLSVVMSVGLLPISVKAEIDSTLDEGGEIISFAELPAEITSRNVVLGTMESELNLPNTLTATVRVLSSKEEEPNSEEQLQASSVPMPEEETVNASTEEDTVNVSMEEETVDVANEEETVTEGVETSAEISDSLIEVPVTWTASPQYDGSTEKEYLFTPELPEHFTLSDDVELPTITITVGQAVTYGEITAFDALKDEIRWQNNTSPTESIDYVVGRGLIEKTSATTFSPDMAITREVLVKALGKLAEAQVKSYKSSSFTDVKTNSSYLPYIEWASKMGIIQGIGNNQFAPTQAVTREEMATIFANYAKITGDTLPVTREVISFTDSENIGSTYKMAVTDMQQSGILLGESNNRFNPKASATRAEVSAMLYRYIKRTIDPATAQGFEKNDAGQWMYFQDGKALTGWIKNSNGEWIYLPTDNGIPSTSTVQQPSITPFTTLK